MRSTLALLSLTALALFVRTWRRTRPRAAAAAPTTDWCAIKPEWCAEEESARKNPLYKPVAHCHHELSFNKHNSSHAADLSSVYDPHRHRRLVVGAWRRGCGDAMGCGAYDVAKPLHGGLGARCARELATPCARRDAGLRFVAYEAGLCGISGEMLVGLLRGRELALVGDATTARLALLLACDLARASGDAAGWKEEEEGGAGFAATFSNGFVLRHVPLPGAGAVRGGGDDRRWREWYANSPLANASAAWAAVWRRLATADIALVAPVRAAASDDDKAPFKAHASRVAQLAAAVDRHPCRAAGLLELLPAHRPAEANGEGCAAHAGRMEWRNARLRDAGKEWGAYVVDIESLLLGRHDAHADDDECVAYCGDWHVYEPALNRVKHDLVRKVLDPCYKYKERPPCEENRLCRPCARSLDGAAGRRPAATQWRPLGPPRARTCGAGGPPLGV